jgi:Serine dehydrogenase proteinase
MTSQITQGDIGRLYEVTSPYRGMPFDLMIETGGGTTDAAEGLVNLLHSLSSDFRVIVPSRAKSNGTLICLAASEILMGVTSELGPIEPSVSQVPATILADDEYKNLGYLMHKMGKFALDQTRLVAISILKKGMLSSLEEIQIHAVVEMLCTRTHFPSHGSVINHSHAKEKLFLNVKFLQEDDPLWKSAWLLHCMYTFDAKLRGLSKIFEQRTLSNSVFGPDPRAADDMLAESYDQRG